MADGVTTGISSAALNAYKSSASAGSSEDSDAVGDFASLVGDALKGAVQTQKTAEQMTVAAASGGDIPMHEVIQAVSKAELTLSTMMTVRDRAVEAYQEILRMPI